MHSTFSLLMLVVMTGQGLMMFPTSQSFVNNEVNLASSSAIGTERCRDQWGCPGGSQLQ